MGALLTTNYTATDVERFWRLVVKGPECWEFSPASPGYGSYGSIRIDGRIWLAHRFAYVLEHGALPQGQIDHLCRNTRCVRPGHLEVVTAAVNSRRKFLHKTTCIHDHPLTGDNLVLKPNGRNPELPPWRQCRECTRARVRRNRALARGRP